MTNEEIGVLNTPQFMGLQKSNPAHIKQAIEQVRSFIKRQKRIKGFSFEVPVGTNQFNLEVSGNARMMLGIALYGSTAGDNLQTGWSQFTAVTSLNFTVNNEIILDQLNPNFLTDRFNNEEYYYLPRPLSGQDTITISLTNTGAVTEQVNLAFYYI